MRPKLVEHQGEDCEKLDSFLSERIYEFNSLAIACFDGKLFGYAMQDERGQVIAGGVAIPGQVAVSSLTCGYWSRCVAKASAKNFCALSRRRLHEEGVQLSSYPCTAFSHQFSMNS
jgi:hypothetical protein